MEKNQNIKIHCIFTAYIKTNDVYKKIEEDVETTFDTSNYYLVWPLPKGKNKKVIGSIKDQLGKNYEKLFWNRSKK